MNPLDPVYLQKSHCTSNNILTILYKQLTTDHDTLMSQEYIDNNMSLA